MRVRGAIVGCAVGLLAVGWGIAGRSVPPIGTKRAFAAPVFDRDPLLETARAELAAGGLTAPTRSALVSSSDPAHARARRVLAAMQEEPAAPAPSEGAIPIEPPSLATVAAGRPLAPPARSHEESSPKPKPKPKARAGAAAMTSSGQPTLRRLELSGSERGATLTLDAGSGVVVGVANQKRSGIVRLLVEAGAGAKVLAARPRVRGARVGAVRRVGRSVFITLHLEPGWSLHRIRETGRGARVQLRAPA